MDFDAIIVLYQREVEGRVGVEETMKSLAHSYVRFIEPFYFPSLDSTDIPVLVLI